MCMEISHRRCIPLILPLSCQPKQCQYRIRIRQLTFLNPSLPRLLSVSAFELDPFYQQWIDVAGFPVVASEKVNPYALKEAAWLIWQMIGHRPDVLQALVQNRARYVWLDIP